MTRAGGLEPFRGQEELADFECDGQICDPNAGELR